MLEAVIVPRTRDLGNGFQMRRAMPAIPGETEFIPLPGKALRIADYP